MPKETFCQVLMQTRAAKEEPFVNLDWAPRILKDSYPPVHLEGKGAGASPIVFMFRNGKLRSGHTGPWCIGSATWLLVQQGPVIVIGTDLDHAHRDSKDPVATTHDLVDKMQSLSPVSDSGSRVRFQVYATTGSLLWVPQGTALALLGMSTRGPDSPKDKDPHAAVVFFPWLSPNLVREHTERHSNCAKSIAQVSIAQLETKGSDAVYECARKLMQFFKG